MDIEYDDDVTVEAVDEMRKRAQSVIGAEEWVVVEAETAWKKYRKECLAIRASKSDFLAGFEAALSDATYHNHSIHNAAKLQGEDHE